MAISIDYHDITAACEKFNLEPTDYYLEFTDQVIYMYWVACPADIHDYMKGDMTCLDYQRKGKWLSFEECSDQYEERPFTNMRYILETN